jgi:23S rRNA (cytosine1962-C5)-methyltransferase
LEGLKDGDLVQVAAPQGDIVATGHFHHGSIAVRILSFGEGDIGPAFWLEKLQVAFAKRRALGLPSTDTDAFRLVHGEGDGLPGLVVDVYGDTAVLQCHSIGMHRCRKDITAAILACSEGRLRHVFDKSKESLPFKYARGIHNSYIGEERPKSQAIIQENGHRFLVDWDKGQKTGFFLDQRDNRQLLGQYAQGKSVLNTFCYSGGFSVYAMAAGAQAVHSVDVSKKAMAWTDQNIALLPSPSGTHHSHTADVMDFLKSEEQRFDIVVVDPPAFAKNMHKRHNAVQGYKRLNALAIKRVKPGGLLFTFSCSQVIDTPLFQNTILAAALEAGRPASILHRLGQSPDHPVSLFHPEGNYLKGLVLWVG